LAIVRGDRDVNEAKLAKVIRIQPQPASDERIQQAGGVPGFASPMGLDPDSWRVVVDHTVATTNNLVAGANEVDYHYKNFNLERDLPGIETVDIVEVQEGDGSPVGEGRLHIERGIEVGNIFQLGDKYTQAMGMTYLDENGKAAVPVMGCYGIGVGRLFSSVMEVRRDEYGPKWPMTIAPWHVHLNALKMDAGDVREVAEKLYGDLRKANLEVLFDDRDARPGSQFADADLLGAPVRLIVSERNLKNGEIEWKRRDTGESGTLPVEKAAETAREWVEAALSGIEKNVPDSL
jgi:prolyl-tRNA synthetase